MGRLVKIPLNYGEVRLRLLRIPLHNGGEQLLQLVRGADAQVVVEDSHRRAVVLLRLRLPSARNIGFYEGDMEKFLKRLYLNRLLRILLEQAVLSRFIEEIQQLMGRPEENVLELRELRHDPALVCVVFEKPAAVKAEGLHIAADLHLRALRFLRLPDLLGKEVRVHTHRQLRIPPVAPPPGHDEFGVRKELLQDVPQPVGQILQSARRVDAVIPRPERP